MTVQSKWDCRGLERTATNPPLRNMALLLGSQFGPGAAGMMGGEARRHLGHPTSRVRFFTL